jgi:hypothetical protein
VWRRRYSVQGAPGGQRRRCGATRTRRRRPQLDCKIAVRLRSACALSSVLDAHGRARAHTAGAQPPDERRGPLASAERCSPGSRRQRKSRARHCTVFAQQWWERDAAPETREIGSFCQVWDKRAARRTRAESGRRRKDVASGMRCDFADEADGHVRVHDTQW